MSAGSDHEPSIDPTQVVEQMRSASERLRDQAMVIAAMTSPPPDDVIIEPVESEAP